MKEIKIISSHQFPLLIHSLCFQTPDHKPVPCVETCKYIDCRDQLSGLLLLWRRAQTYIQSGAGRVSCQHIFVAWASGFVIESQVCWTGKANGYMTATTFHKLFSFIAQTH